MFHVAYASDMDLEEGVDVVVDAEEVVEEIVEEGVFYLYGLDILKIFSLGVYIPDVSILPMTTKY